MIPNRGKKITFVGVDEKTFNSITALSQHLSISIPRLVNFLDGRTTLTEKDYEQLVKMSYELPQFGVPKGNKNSKKGK